MLRRLWFVLASRLSAAKPRRVWLGLGAILALVIGVSALGSRTSDQKLLVGRIWIDRLPQRDTDHYEAFVAVEESSVGVFQRASAYEGAFEIFKYEPRGDGKLQLLFPQSKKKYDVKYDAKTCREKDFDYCLALVGAPRGVPKYYSKKGWEIDGRDSAELERALVAWEAKHVSTEPDSE